MQYLIWCIQWILEIPGMYYKCDMLQMHLWAYSIFSKPTVWIGYFPGAHIHSPGCVSCRIQSPPCAGCRRSGAAAELAPSPAASARPRPSAWCSSNRRRSRKKQCERNDFKSTSSCQAHGWNGVQSILTSLSNSLTSLSKRLVAFLGEKGTVLFLPTNHRIKGLLPFVVIIITPLYFYADF